MVEDTPIISLAKGQIGRRRKKWEYNIEKDLKE
jgi:hypothetical protein